MIDLRTKQGWDDLKRALDDRMLDVLRRLKLPEPKGNGTILISDPRGGDANPSFAIWCYKPGGLSWKKYNGSEGGRTLELIAYCNGWYDLPKRGADEAARWAMDKLGLGRVTSEQLERDRAAAVVRNAEQSKKSEADALRKRKAALATFINAEPVLDTPAEIYLRDIRGIDLRAAPFVGPRGGSLVPHCLRFIPQHKYVHRAKNGQKIGESFHPCLIAACVDADMKIAAIHQTFLRDDGMGKAEFAPAPDGTEQPQRKVWPESMGCVIPLWRGADHLSIKQAKEHGIIQTMVLTEGIEDGLSAVLAAPQHRVWAMISLSNMVNVAPRLPECVDAVIVHRQNDWDKRQAIEQFDRGMKAIGATGRIYAEVHAAQGKDLNDTQRGVGEYRVR